LGVLSRRLAAIRVQRSWRIPLAALDEFLRERLIPRLRLTNKLANENLEAAELNEDASMNWGGWGGPGWVGRR